MSTSKGGAAVLAARMQSFTKELHDRAKRLDAIQASAATPDAAAMYAALKELRAQHEELLVVEEELTAQIDELQAAQMRIETERARYRHLFDNAPVAYVVTNERGVLVEANHASLALLGMEARFVRGKPLTVFVDPFDMATVRDLIDAAATSAQVREVRLRRRTGQRFWASLSCAPSEHGRRLLWNITDLGEPRAEDRDVPDVRRIAGLEREVRDKEDLLARERRLRQQMERAEQAKDRFIAVLSHDLRAPLNAVLGWTDLLRREILSKDARDRALATIDRNARMQLGLVEELLDLSRITADRLRLELMPLDLGSLVERLVAAFEPNAKEAGVELTCSIAPLAIFGDRKRLEQVVTNLVTNALKFTPKGGTIRIATSREGHHAVLRVVDSGVGIASDALPRVFDWLEQDGSSSSARTGLGLGLYIVRHLVELHGGSVEAESEGEGRGAAFVVRLPAHAADVPHDAPSEHVLRDDVPDLDGVRILVVDDDEDARELMSMVLLHKGAHVAVADDADTALAMFDSCMPDVLVSDIGLPGEDGLTLLDRLRARAPQLPAVAVSGFAAMTDAQQAIAAGFDLHVAKPVEPGRLVAAIRQVLDARASKPDS
jgi:PAS domain S-box-containing protein